MSDGELARRLRWAPLLGRREVADSVAMEALGAQLSAVLRAGDVVILVGSLGAGKTTLTRGLGRALGLRDSVTSPTFVVARTHRRRDGELPALIHVDAYRLRSAAEFDDLDLDVERSIVVVEWGEDVAEGLADEWLVVRIDRPTGAEVGAAAEDLDAETPRVVTIEACAA